MEADDIAVVLEYLPMPPTSNHMYAISWRNKRRFKSKEFVRFERDCRSFYLQNQDEVDTIAQALQEAIEDGYLVRVDRFFCFSHHRIHRKSDNAPKKLDVTNRIKPLDDQLAIMLDIDDKYFWTGIAEKIDLGEDDSEGVILCLSLVKPQTITEIREKLGEETTKH